MRRKATWHKRLNRAVSVMLASVFACTVFVTSPVKVAAASVPLAQWVFTSNPSASPAPATGGSDASGAALIVNSTKSGDTVAKTPYATSGWDNGIGTKYWQFTVPAGANATGMTFAAKIKESNTAPKNWVAQTTTDGVHYTNVTSGVTFSVTTASVYNDIQFNTGSTTLPLPDHTVGIRLTPADNTSVNNGTVASGGTCYLNNIVISGTESGSTPAVTIAPVTATTSVPAGANNSVPEGTTVTLACATAGAQIYYSINGGADQSYLSPIILTQTTTIKAYAVLGSDKSDFYTFTYTDSSATGSTTIADARSKTGSAVTVTGVVTRLVSSSSLYIQDSTGGICVFGGSYTAANYPVGTPVSVTATVTHYTGSKNDCMELTSPTVTKTGGAIAPIAPAPVSLSDFSTNYKNYEGKLIQIKGATLKVSGTSYSITSGTSSVPIYLKNNAKISAANGSTVDITGIAAIYSNAAELYFTDPGDLTVGSSGSGSGSNQPSSGQVAPVSAKPGSGAVVKVGDSITLSTTTGGATIKYMLNGASAYSDYSGPVAITSLPLTISAYAVKDGMSDSVKTTVTYDAPYSGTYNVYFGQLHSHTTLSDGQGTVEQAFAHAAGVANLDFLAVTDHSNYFESAADAGNHVNTILDGHASASWAEGHQAAANITSQQISKNNLSDPSAKFLGIYGYEMTWSDGSGHINTFNTSGFEDRQNPYYDNKVQSASNPSGLQKYYDTLTTVPQSASQFNHPGTSFGDFYDFADYSPAYDSLMDMVEVGNGEGPIRGAGYFPSYDYYTRALDKGWHVAPTNNQDNHKGNWGDSNTARSVVLAQNLSESSLYDAMKQHRIYATEDNDLSIQYSLNGNIMGSVISVATGDPITLKADLSDPTDASIGTVQVISNGGRVVAQKTLNTNKGTVEFDLNNNYSYYYLRITEPDSDIAVTAPVWTHDVDKAGIASTTADTTLPVKGEPIHITSSLYNNDPTPLQLESLQYSIGGQVINTVSGSQLNGGKDISPLGTTQYQFTYTPTTSGDQVVNVTLTAMENGVEKTYTGTLSLSVADPKTVTRVLIDGTHYNNYVSGYYAGNMNNFTQIAASEGTQVKIATNAADITPDILKSIQLLVITSPATKGGTTAGGTPYTAQTFSDSFIAMVKDYVAGGGQVVVCSTSDYGDGTGDYKAAAQVNKLLQGIGATARSRSDEMMDDTNNGGQAYRLYLQNFNTGSNSPLLHGIVTGANGQKYSAYSGCSIDPGNATSLVNGFDTTYAKVSCTSAPNVGAVTASKGSYPSVLAEESVGSGKVITSSAVLLSDFEIKAPADNNWDLPYANYTIMLNLLKQVKINIPTTSIADVRKNGQEGDVFAVEGTVTAGTEQPNAFTDTLYIQDSTGGLDIYPIANGSGIKVGQKVRVVGHVSSYQGDKELKIGSGMEGYEVTDTTINPVLPVSLSAKDAMDYAANGGRLVSVTGKVTNIQQDGGVIQSFFLTDGSNTNGARIFINGYINPGMDLSGVVKDGATVKAVGLVYADTEGVSLRVRDKNEITSVQVSTGSDSDSGNSTGGGTSGGTTPGSAAASGSSSAGNSTSGGTTSGSAAASSSLSNVDSLSSQSASSASMSNIPQDSVPKADAHAGSDSSGTASNGNSSPMSLVLIIFVIVIAGTGVTLFLIMRRRTRN